MGKNYDSLGPNIKKLRDIRNNTQEELGRVLNLPKQSISRIEKGKRTVSPDELKKIALFFRIHENFILNDGWIDQTYKNSIPDNKWNVAIPEFIENFLYGLEEYLEESLYSSIFTRRTAKKILRGTSKALRDISKEYDKKE